jgi:hypothetical protein
MAKLHAYYVTNAKEELKYVYQGLQEEKFYEEVQKNLSEHLVDNDDIIEVEEEFEDENSDISDDENDDGTNNNDNRIDEYLNLASEELR